MIKQLLSSAGNKEAGLATNITKTAGANSEQTAPGLFGSILKTVQGFGQQQEPDTGNAQKGEEGQEEAKVIGEDSSVETEVVSEEKKVINEVEENNQELTGTEMEGEKLAPKEVEVKTNSEAGEETTLKNDSDELAITGSTKQETEQPVASNSTIGSGESSKDASAKEAIKPTAAAETENIRQAAVMADNQLSGDAKDNGSISSQPDSSEVSNEDASQIFKGDVSDQTSDGLKVEVADAETESDTELQETNEGLETNSSSPDTGNKTSATPLTSEAGISQQNARKVAEQAAVNNAQKQQVTESTESNETEPEAEADVAKQTMQAATGQTASGAPEVNQSIQSKKVEEAKEKKFRENYSFSGRQELTSERLDVITQSREAKAPLSFLSQLDVPVQAVQNQMSPGQNTTMTTEQELMLKEYLKESVEMTEQKDATNALFARMGEMPVSNMFVRRTVLPSLTQAVQKTISAGKATPETWQKHSFELEDGNSIQLSTRQVDGVLQVKLATTSVELSRLMQQYEQEIKQHLEQECQLDVNLQFDGGEQGQEMAGFFGNSSSSRQRAPILNTGTGNDQAAAQKTDQNLQQTVRRFGYNQMEWTA